MSVSSDTLIKQQLNVFKKRKEKREEKKHALLSGVCSYPLIQWVQNNNLTVPGVVFLFFPLCAQVDSLSLQQTQPASSVASSTPTVTAAGDNAASPASSQGQGAVSGAAAAAASGWTQDEEEKGWFFMSFFFCSYGCCCSITEMNTLGVTRYVTVHLYSCKWSVEAAGWK